MLGRTMPGAPPPTTGPSGDRTPEAPEAPPPPPPSPLELEVAERLRPTEEELRSLAHARGALVSAALAEAAKRSIPLRKALIAGSAARETYLPPSSGGRLDLDLFLLFDPSLPREKLSELGLTLAGALLRSPEKRYAEHPYLRGEFEGFDVDAVPGYEVSRSDRPQTAVDRTPFHHAYLVPRLGPRAKDEVRLLKRFLRTLGIYGADTRTEGFSGYLVELLIVRYGSLSALLEEALSWHIPQRLCPPGPEPATSAEVALVLPDPVDPHRNVASALSRENFALFLMAAQVYHARPRRAFFFPPTRPALSAEELQATQRSRGTEVVALTFPAPDLVDDILYPQLRKCERALLGPLERWGFEVLRTSSAKSGTEAAVVAEIDRAELGPTLVRAGPPVGSRETAKFLERWTPGTPGLRNGPYLSSTGHLQVDLERSVRDVVGLLLKELAQMGFGKNLQEPVTRHGTVRLLAPASATEALTSSPALLEALRALYGRGLPWRDWPQEG